MAPRQIKRVSVNRQKSTDYFKVAQNFRHGAEVAKEFEYWNAAGVLIVHAAIAVSDALTIKIGGSKIRGDDHMAIVDLIHNVVILDDSGKSAINHLLQIIQQKNLVSYSGEIYTKKDVDSLWKHLDRYWNWASSIV